MLALTALRRCAATATTTAAPLSSTSLVSLTAAGLASHKQRLVQQLATCEAQLNAMEKQHAAINEAAHLKSRTVSLAGGALLTLQTTTLFVWTYSTFDWNLVEPITFLLAYGVVWLTVAMYLASGRDFTYAEVRESVAEKARRKLFAEKGFDVDAFRRLQFEVADLKASVEGLENVKGPE